MELKDYVGLLTHPENQPHQYVDRHDDLLAELSALSRQAPVPTRSDPFPSPAVSVEQIVQELEAFGDDFDGGTAAGATFHLLASRLKEVLAAPVPTSGAVEVARQILDTCAEVSEGKLELCYSGATAIIQQYGDGSYQEGLLRAAHHVRETLRHRFNQDYQEAIARDIETLAGATQNPAADGASMSAKEWPDEVKEGIMWLMARIAHDDRSIYGGSADEERALIKYINNLRTQVRAQPPAAHGKCPMSLTPYEKSLHDELVAARAADGKLREALRKLCDAMGAYFAPCPNWDDLPIMTGPLRTAYKEARAALAQPASGGGAI